MRIFDSQVETKIGQMGTRALMLTSVPFNDAYQYMDLVILTVPLLLLEIILVMVSVSGYYGGSVVAGDLTSRWLCRFVSMILLYIWV